MPRILTTQKDVVSGITTIGAEGKVFRLNPGVFGGSAPPLTAFREMPLPAGTQGVKRRPSWAQYNAFSRSRAYGVGAWTANILIDEHMRSLRQGIPAPTIVPTVAAAAGPGVTETSTCALRFLDYLGGRTGPLSASTAVALANQKRAWSSLPTTCQDPSVSHIQGLVRSEGATSFRVAWTRQLGVASITEAVTTGQLGEAAPDDFTEMPQGNINAIYHYTQWVAGNEQFPERCFRSALGEPEHYEGAFAQTDGEAVVGMFTSNNNFIFGSTKRIYRATGYENLDLGREIEKPDIGLVGHFGHVPVHGRHVVVTTIGFFLYNGGEWVFLGGDRQSEWKREYATYRTDYDTAAGFWDPVRRVYTFGPVRHSVIGAGTLWTHWVLDGQKLFPEYSPQGPVIALTNDARTRKLEGFSYWPTPGSAQGRVFSGACNGTVYEENNESNGDDAADSYGKLLTIEPPPIMPDPGGSQVDGNTFHKAWSYMECHTKTWVVEFRSGTLNARSQPAATFTDTTGPYTPSGSELSSEAATVHPHVLEYCAGEALQTKYTVASPVGVKFRGYGGTYGPGLMKLSPVNK